MWADVHANTMVSSLFGGFGVVPTIAANARVAVMQILSASGFRPLAIANPDYTTGECAWARFGSQNPVPLTLGAGGHWRATTGVQVFSSNLPVSAIIGDCTDASERITYDNVGYIGQYSQGQHSAPHQD